MGNIHLYRRLDISYDSGMTYQEIVEIRLKQLKIGPVEVVTRSSVAMDRYFVRDLLMGKKRTVRSGSLPALAEVLQLDLKALAQGELVPTDSSEDDPTAIKAVVDEVTRIMREADEDGRDAILGKARSIELAAQRRGQKGEAPPDLRPKGDS